MTSRSHVRKIVSSAAVIAPLGAMRSAAKTNAGAFLLMISEVWQPRSLHVLRIVRVVVAQAIRYRDAASAYVTSPVATYAIASP